jgi:hypothetical protein
MRRINLVVTTVVLVIGAVCGLISTYLPVKADFIKHYFNPEYESIKPRLSCGPGIKVVRGETQQIIPAFKSRCPIASIFKFNNGDILVQGKEQLLPPTNGDEGFIVKKRSRRSNNGGKTWHKVNYYDEDFPLRLESAYQYPGAAGEVVVFADHTEEINKTEIQTVHKTGFLRSKDNGLTWEKDSAVIRLDKEYESSVPTRRIVALSDGSLITSLYCSRFSENKLRTVVIHSVDRGKTWDYLSTVAYDGIEERHTVHYGRLPLLRSLGFCEPSLAVLPNGRLYCFTRSGCSYIASTSGNINCETCSELPFSFLEQTPVYMSISEDEGKSWSNADPVAPIGVFPDVVYMSNGIMAVNYGRPGNWIMFSKDQGVSWGPVIQFYHDLYPPDCSNYFSMAEIDEGILLAVYARTDQNDHWQSEIVGTYFKVMPEEE